MCSKQKPQTIITLEKVSHVTNHSLMLQILAIYHNLISPIHESERNTLTNLLSRKTLDLKVNDIITGLKSHVQNQTDAHSYSAIFDLDHLKQVNDAHRHLIGDEVLLLFSHQMHKNFRDKDLLFRFGGEEFVGIFQCTDDDTITHILGRFREPIAAFNFPQVELVTVSCRFTKIDAFDLSSKRIDCADLSLYYAKYHGRNQICQNAQLISAGTLQKKESSSGEVELF